MEEPKGQGALRDHPQTPKWPRHLSAFSNVVGAGLDPILDSVTAVARCSCPPPTRWRSGSSAPSSAPPASSGQSASRCRTSSIVNRSVGPRPFNCLEIVDVVAAAGMSTPLARGSARRVPRSKWYSNGFRASIDSCTTGTSAFGTHERAPTKCAVQAPAVIVEADVHRLDDLGNLRDQHRQGLDAAALWRRATSRS